jgi:hypothetical protein
MRTVRTLNIDKTRDLRLAGMTDEEICAWGYFAALKQGCEQICIILQNGWERIYPMTNVRAMLLRRADLQSEVNMGINRFNRQRQLESGKLSLRL